LLAFVDNLVGWIGDRLDETDTTDPRARLLEYIDRFMIDEGDDEHRDFVVALFELRLQGVHNEQFRKRLARHYRGNVQACVEILEDGMEEGVFREFDAELVGEAIYNAIEGARLYQVVLGADGAAKRMEEIMLEFVVGDLIVMRTYLR
jgi:hypothetical protein